MKLVMREAKKALRLVTFYLFISTERLLFIVCIDQCLFLCASALWLSEM